MNKGVFTALKLLEEEKGIPLDFMIDKISKAISIACKSNYSGNDDVVLDIDVDKNRFDVYLRKTVVEEVSNKDRQISISDARAIDPGVGLEEKVSVKLDTKDFGRIAAQTARNMIRQGIKDGEREQMFHEFQRYKQEFVTAEVDRIDPNGGSITLKIGKLTASLQKNEQLPNEKLKEGDHIKVYIADVKETDRGPRVIISRSHPDLVKRLFEKEVPEIYDGTIEIKSIAREAGLRTKIAVFSNDENVDAIGSCIGSKGMRVGAIGKELGGEKIDIIEYSDDPKKFIASALAPAEVVLVKDENLQEKTCQVIVPDSQLSLAIGNKGQNARLAARLTGWKIDIKPESSLNQESSDTDNTSQV